jgi:hypothetical protein
MDVGLRKSDNTRRWRSSETTILPSHSPTLNYALPIKVTFALQCTSLTFFLHAFSLSFHLRFAWCYTPWFSIARLCMLSVRTSTRYPFQTTLCKATDQVDLDILCRRGAWNSPLAWSIGAGLRTTICSLVPIKKDTIYIRFLQYISNKAEWSRYLSKLLINSIKQYYKSSRYSTRMSSFVGWVLNPKRSCFTTRME